MDAVKQKKVISFCLWGENPLYIDGAVWNARHAKEFYPDWICRFYHDNSVPSGVLDRIRGTGAEDIMMYRTSEGLGMFWRFHPMFDDPSIERFIVRDTDSKFSYREVKAVNEWIDGGKPFHVIRDCESHQASILGGTWGAIPGCVKDFRLRMSLFFQRLQPVYQNPRGPYHGMDQIFLHNFVWPVIKDNHLAHIRAGMDKLRYTGDEVELPFLENGHYVGMVC